MNGWGCRAGDSAAGGGLEELYEVAIRVREQDLTATGSGDHFTAERKARGAEPVDLGVQVVEHQVDAVASGNVGLLRRGSGAGAGRTRQEKSAKAGPALLSSVKPR